MQVGRSAAPVSVGLLIHTYDAAPAKQAATATGADQRGARACRFNRNRPNRFGGGAPYQGPPGWAYTRPNSAAGEGCSGGGRPAGSGGATLIREPGRSALP